MTGLYASHEFQNFQTNQATSIIYEAISYGAHPHIRVLFVAPQRTEKPCAYIDFSRRYAHITEDYTMKLWADGIVFFM